MINLTELIQELFSRNILVTYSGDFLIYKRTDNDLLSIQESIKGVEYKISKEGLIIYVTVWSHYLNIYKRRKKQ